MIQGRIFRGLKSVALGGVALASLLAPVHSSEIEDMYNKIGSTATEQHYSLVKILLGNRVPRPQMDKVYQEVCASECTFRHNFEILAEYCTTTISSITDGVEFKEWAKANMKPNESSDEENLYKQYSIIIDMVNELKTVLFSGTVNQVNAAMRELKGEEAEEEPPAEETPEEPPATYTLTGTIEAIRTALNTLTAIPPAEDPVVTPEEPAEEEPVVSETLLERVERFIKEIEPPSADSDGGVVYSLINKIKTSATNPSIASAHYISKHLFETLHASAITLRYNLQVLPKNVQTVIDTITDQVFMDSILERVLVLGKALAEVQEEQRQVRAFLSFENPDEEAKNG